MKKNLVSAGAYSNLSHKTWQLLKASDFITRVPGWPGETGSGDLWLHICGWNFRGSCHDRYIGSLGSRSILRCNTCEWLKNYREVDFTTLQVHPFMFGWMQLSCCFTYLRVLSKGDGWKGFANQCPQRKFSVRWFCALLQHTIYQDGNKQFIDNCQAVSKPYVILLEFTSDLLVCTLCTLQ